MKVVKVAYLLHLIHLYNGEIFCLRRTIEMEYCVRCSRGLAENHTRDLCVICLRTQNNVGVFNESPTLFDSRNKTSLNESLLSPISRENGRSINSLLGETHTDMAENLFKGSANSIRWEMAKSLILQLQEEVGTLKEEITFLREDIVQKNSLIGFFVSQSTKTSTKPHVSMLANSN